MGAIHNTTETSDGTVEATKLAALIMTSVEDVVKEYRRVGATVPSLHSIEPGPFDDQRNMTAKLSQAIKVIEAACAQLCFTVANPGHVVINHKANTFQEPVGLHIVTSAKIADILLEKPEGLHINVLAQHAGLDPNKLGRILRMLATRHCFSEVRPNVFANNRISMQLISANPVASYVGHITDEPLKSVVHLNETLTDPATAFSSASGDSTFRRVYGVSMFEGLDTPKRAKIRDRFAQAMVGWSKVTARVPLSKSYPWDTVAADSTVCDIGGGNGHATLGLLRDFPNLKVVLQDLPAVIEQGRKFWIEQNPQAVENKRVQFIGLDFFGETPVGGCDFYYLRHVLHDWPKKECVRILENVRKAMKPSSKLILHEFVLQPAVRNSGASDKVPEPLLSNFGVARICQYNQDITMMNLLNGQERTLQDFVEICESTGFKLQKLWDSGEEGLLEFSVV